MKKKEANLPVVVGVKAPNSCSALAKDTESSRLIHLVPSHTSCTSQSVCINIETVLLHPTMPSTHKNIPRGPT